MTRITNKMIRKDILDAGAERVIIKRDGNVLAYGRMPNTDQVGWYLAGTINELKVHLRRYLRTVA
jgi:hypothetical protein